LVFFKRYSKVLIKEEWLFCVGLQSHIKYLKLRFISEKKVVIQRSIIIIVHSFIRTYNWRNSNITLPEGEMVMPVITAHD
jgi:hypothetical protein